MFGLQPATYLVAGAAPKLWWGARAIYNPSAKFAAQLIELLPDRQQFNSYEDKKACTKLSGWINRKGLGKLRKELRLNFVAPNANKLTWIREGGFNLLADPKASHGYLYLCAWRDDACPTPEPVPNSSSPPA